MPQSVQVDSIQCYSVVEVTVSTVCLQTLLIFPFLSPTVGCASLLPPSPLHFIKKKMLLLSCSSFSSHWSWIDSVDMLHVDLLLTMLQMGSGVHSNTAAVSSPPADLQSVSSQPPFPNSPQVRSQTGHWLGMWQLHVAYLLTMLVNC